MARCKGVAEDGKTVGTIRWEGNAASSKFSFDEDEPKISIQAKAGGGRIKVRDGLQAVHFFKRLTSTGNIIKDVTV